METLLKTFNSNDSQSFIQLKFDHNREEDSIENVSVTFFKNGVMVDLTGIFEDDDEFSAFLDDLCDRIIAKQ